MALKEEVKRILRHSSIYGIGNLLHRIPPFVLMPIYLNYLTPTDYGKKEIVALVIEFLGIILSMGIANAMARFYYEYDKEVDQNEVVSTIILSFAVIAGIVIGSITTQAESISKIIIDSPSEKALILMALVSLWFNTLYHMSCNYIRIRERSILFVSISFSRLIVQVSLNIFFIVSLGWGIYGIFASTLISSSVFATALTLPLLCKIGFKFSISKFREILKFSSPMIVSQLGASIVHLSDRYFLKVYFGLASAGIYTLGYRLGNSINSFVQSPFQQIWNPRKFAIHKDQNSREIYARVLTYYLFVQFIFGLIISCCAKDILFIVGRPAYYQAASIAPIITLSYILFGIQNHFTTGIMIKKKTGYFAYINMGNAALNLALNFALIPPFGIWGAALATLACMTNKFVFTAWISQKIFPIPWELKRAVRIILAGLLAYLLSHLIRYPEVYKTYVLNYEIYKGALRILGLRFMIYHMAVAVGVYLSIISLPGFFQASEIGFLKEKAKKIKNSLSFRLSST